MAKLAFLFPGQGSQYPGMGRDLAQNFASARQVFEEVDAALGIPLSKICWEGSEQDLKKTENTQPAILTASVAAFRVLRDEGVTPDVVAGHSLGEYSALVAAGGLELADAARLVRKRGQYMQEAVAEGEGAMAAILGLPPAEVVEITKKAGESEVLAAANLNSMEQTVISGRAAAVKRAVEMASQLGAKRAVMLPVSAPFHCELMMPAQKKLEADLRAAKFRDLSFPLFVNVDAEAITSGEDARDALIRQVCMPVRWYESIQAMIADGIHLFIEVGPGKVLSGLLRQIDRGVRCVGVDDSATLAAALEKIHQVRAEKAEA
jgi:[acyl-carrier-protein] S-malonyltransferase